ncbi:MAG: NUDIX domain-containing protein [Bacteroidetes bacterium]|nr:NUDIX domain-containing protein [Bacteroidota bacterium]
MYKVFINDKEITFKRSVLEDKITKDDSYEKKIHELSAKLINSKKGLSKNITLISNRPFFAMHAFLKTFKKISAAGGIVSKSKNNDPILMIFRLGKWDLPKGKTEKGENLSQAAIREVREECGIKKLRIIKKLPPTYHLYVLKNEWVVKKTAWFLMNSAYTGTLTPQAEEGIQQVKWVPKTQLKSYLSLSYSSIAHLIRTEILDL